MGKAEFLSPKAIGNRIKSKGLQKLRWYCQMCQKQCRDENGFKCHCMSESHQRQLLLASENPDQFMDYFSESTLLNFFVCFFNRIILYPVYQIVYLVKETSFFTELKRENEEEKVAFSLNKGPSTSAATSSKSSTSLGPSALQAATASVKRKEASHSSESKEKKKKSALDEIIEMEEQKKKTSRTDYWLHPNIVVKVLTKRLGDNYYKKKGLIKDVQGKYTAIIKMVDSGDKLKIDQAHLETVIPAPGKRVLVLNGGYRGSEAILDSIDEKKFTALITIDSVSVMSDSCHFAPYTCLNSHVPF
ncbi:KIN17 protein, partial [Polyodon spathula]|nr:KIN17 protein [Polyodon spathula]